MKVYCIECKNMEVREDNNFCKNITECAGTPLMQGSRRVECKKANPDNKCRCYVRKGWKFWD